MSSYTISPPGIVIGHVPASAKAYVGSPSIVMLSDGSYVATHDLFGPGTTYSTTRVFRSTDQGRSWRYVDTLEDSFWGGLFVHRETLYLMGCSSQFGAMAIRKSTDGGLTWSHPTDAKNGLLRDDGRYHTAPVPVVEYGGRLWRAMEDEVKGAREFRAFMVSAAADSDLMDATSWTTSTRLARDPSWLGGGFGGWWEGNAVVGPDGHVVDILRVDYRKGDGEYAAIVRIFDDGKQASFTTDDLVRFPGGCKKFTIRRDPRDGTYWTLSNMVAEGFEDYNVERARNLLVLMKSSDLREWSVTRRVLYHPQIDNHAFQYVDWQFEDEDIIVASRTAFDDGCGGAHNQHDANFMTFHRVEQFRTALPA
ncbi:MAG: exo-alpha-sialidase [Spirochaetaceae bacterium]|nr:MAG: exo-alpha-sialidase [Spirochaetaceae bacterium]